MNKLIRRPGALARTTPLATQLLADYTYWFERKYSKKPGTYLTNAKSFLKTYKAGSLRAQIATFGRLKSHTLRSFLKRFIEFLDERGVDLVINDLDKKPLPRSNPYVKLFLLHARDRLRGDLSLSTYATVLNHYFVTVRENPRNINKQTAEYFIFSRDLSDYTVRLYKAVLKAFCRWVAEYQTVPNKNLNGDQQKLKKVLLLISVRSLKEIIELKVRSHQNQLKSYHKECLTMPQRRQLLASCECQRDRAIISLMAWNGLRTIEVTRLSIHNLRPQENKIEVWGKGRSAKSREAIRLFKVPKAEVTKYVRETGLTKGRLFDGFSRQAIDAMIKRSFEKLRLGSRHLKYSPHSLRHTSGQVMYDKGVKLEFIQKTLRHATMENTLVYAQRAIDRSYFKTMPLNV
ncbi:MAG: tyrosine-type recombinase/integrase [Proteobacteria bacterium]|jgi:integrase/recombinase XerD|nr:tyrosine-type recombinase/integrase [Pseudomonadota bacterium]MBS1949477.1 tyrosine-type recombinase/integrase [Bacteroidota bacterium]MBS1982517.1 tyrosine-type recombinase/integrase [Bacteroidota bacterium]